MDKLKGALKRVGILLRVSTARQAKQSNKKEADLPTQRKACMDFIAQHPDWVFEKEYVEIGVSGFKNSMNDRDKLLEAHDDIANSMIDVFLVFMYDRVGRLEEETPFVIKKFVEMGAEVWSTQEGQRKFDEHIDSLINYLTFWQAGGESKKTSMRVTESMTQMASEGKYTGGVLPYGYKAIPTGATTKKGLPEKMLAIEESEAKTVRTIYSLSITHNYGCHRIAKHLNENGIPTRKGKQWNNSMVSNILQNPIYKGQKAYNRTTTKGMKKGKQIRKPKDSWTLSEINPEIAIISEGEWEEVQMNIQARLDKTNEQYHLNNELDDVQIGRTKLLFQGFAYCAYCGSKMGVGYSPHKWTTNDGVTHRRKMGLYKCTAKISGNIGCDAKTSYRPDPIEGVVIEEVQHYLKKLQSIELSGEIQKLQKNTLAFEENEMKKLKREKEAAEGETKSLENEVVKVLMGQSSFNADMLNRLLEERKATLADLESRLEESHILLERKKLEQKDLIQLQQMIPVWQDEFENAPLEVKKVLLSKIIERVDISKESVEVTIRMYIQDFISEVGGQNPPPNRTQKHRQTPSTSDSEGVSPNHLYWRPD